MFIYLNAPTSEYMHVYVSSDWLGLSEMDVIRLVHGKILLKKKATNDFLLVI